ncbi:MAG: OmpA family protein [Polyangiaceae bacterium]
MTTSPSAPVSRTLRTRLGVGLLMSVATVLFAPEASAQDTTFSLDRLRIGGAPDDGIGVWRPDFSDRPRLFGQLALGFSWEPFRIAHEREDENDQAKLAQTSGPPVTEQFTGYFTAGFEVFKRIGVQVMFPAVFVQTGNPTSTASVPGDSVDLSIAAAGDLRVELRGAIIADDFFKLGANANLFAPSGNELSFAGDRSASGGLGVSLDLNWKEFILTFDTGFHFRPESGVNDFTVSHEWEYALAGFIPIRDNQFRLGVELFGSVMIAGPDKAKAITSPLEWMVEGKFALDSKKQLYLTPYFGTRMTPGYAPDFRTGIGFGGWFYLDNPNPPSPKKEPRLDPYGGDVDTDKDGYPDNQDLCPTEPEDGKPPATTDGCPAEKDTDDDGIPDSRDKCVQVAEDKDGVDDKDGCPEEDADKDAILDVEDACPKEPGEPSPEKDKNGCPRFIRRIEGSTEIEILKKVEFEFGSARLRADSQPILDEVVRLLQANPDITLLAIEGHTDNVGSDALNLKLSKDRARACLDYLVKKGIAASRLTSDGFGKEKPLDTNDTSEGRAKNRRVEFHIRNQDTSGN